MPASVYVTCMVQKEHLASFRFEILIYTFRPFNTSSTGVLVLCPVAGQVGVALFHKFGKVTGIHEC